MKKVMKNKKSWETLMKVLIAIASAVLGVIGGSAAGSL